LKDDAGPGDVDRAQGVVDAGAILGEGAAEEPGDPAEVRVGRGRRKLADDPEWEVWGDGLEVIEESGDKILGAGGESEQDTLRMGQAR
jgi:hypothetical protein